MIFATKPIEQVDLDLSEDGMHVVGTGHTGDPDDTAFLSMRLRPEYFDGDKQLALDVTSALVRSLVEHFGYWSEMRQ
ncbi:MULTISPECIES: hypothetical protein [Mesorhizobium]|uniref:hypothetical protein n=1 Tax=Mesorhizobium TaxID=68287 RepID=UPI0003CF58A8|nr:MULTISPECIES: hypothetical protein [Mesorhizobium]ESY70003.1 hypothetical protein X742_05680 [Mesorhizobium sp. LNHC232B00]WJI40287.1 hypothetical protein NL534_08615 [Mesorhizobium opportunistum]